MADAMGEATEDNKLQVTEFISVSELANLMDVSFADVISKCMGLGIMVSINQRLDAEVIELVASEFGFDVEFIDMEKHMEMEEEMEEDDEEDLQPRSPIVTIMVTLTMERHHYLTISVVQMWWQVKLEVLHSTSVPTRWN